MLNISPLAFYTDIKGQNHNKAYAFGHVFPLLIKGSALIPFQFLEKYSPAQVHSVNLYDCFLVDFNTGKSTSIHQTLTEAGLIFKYDATSGYLRVLYPGLYPIQAINQEGRYYLQLDAVLNEADKVSYYSEVFTSSNTTTGYIRLDYSSTFDFKLAGSTVDFSGGFKFSCYLPTQIGKPEYIFEEEATERLGYSFIETQVSKKVYKFTALMPEYLCDALRLVRMCDYKKIIDEENNKQYDLISFEMSPEWEEQGDLAAVSCSFETDLVIANTGGYYPEETSFNDDYNEDYAYK